MSEAGNENLREYLTATVGDQLFGLPILRVQDVFVPQRVTRVPLAAPQIAGVLNLRGRIVTLLDMRCLLGLERQSPDGEVMAISIEYGGEFYGLLIDKVGEVMRLDSQSREACPANLDARLARLAAGIHRLESALLVVLDVDRVLGSGHNALAA
jgi:purine-binding chemotaxis protein CheW